MKSIAIVGRLPALSIAELESLLGPASIQPFGNQAVLIDIDTEDIPFERLGGTIRLARILTPLDAKNWRDIESHLLATAAEHAARVPGKLSFGLSVYGFPVKKEQLAKTALSVKKAIKNSGKSVRMVPHTGLELGSAVVYHNKLTGPNGWELLIMSDGKQTYMAQTTNIQNIDAYAARDQARPKRDARVGMLPPKLAQTIINLAGASAGDTLLDPFCGTGVVLQEAGLMGCSVYGTDLDERMVRYSRDNINWLQEAHHVRFEWQLETGDATRYTWRKPIDVVAGETYLGPPLTQLPEPQKMRQIVHDISRLHNKFLENIGKQIKSGTRLCLAIPAWKTKTGFIHLSTLEKLKDLGYTRIDFEFASNDQLVYHREDQLVARELVVLKKD